ncbi:MAG: YadA-like family protein [Phascolarctobacterium sp.]|nr:YadA-like family protein [Phascolarctobacterium sp.]
MKKNLAKRIVLGLLTGAVLMSSSVAWAADYTVYRTGGDGSFGVGYSNSNDSDDTLNPGGVESAATNSIVIGANSVISGSSSIGLGLAVKVTTDHSVAIGSNASVTGLNGVAIGAGAKVEGGLGVALGKDSIASGNVVSVGVADDPATDENEGVYRKIVNVKDGTSAHDAATVGQMEAKTGQVNFSSYSLKYIQDNDNLTTAVVHLDGQVKANASAIESLGNNLVKKDQDNIMSGSVTINDGGNSNNPIVMDDDGITVGTNSTRMDGTGFYVWADNDNNNTNSSHVITDAIAYMNDKGEIKAANGAFMVNASGNVTATKLQISDGNGGTIDVETELGKKADTSYVDSELSKKANQSDLEAETAERKNADTALEQKITDIGGGSSAAIAGLNQRLEKTNAKINKVGAGAAALAALHPLDYDPDDKLTFSAGMGNYAGENAAALGAFYRPNEKFMLSLGGTMGNGENMVNLGLSIGLDKASGFVKMSKRELIQEVNAVKAENEAMKDQLANADERIAKLEALVAQLVAK